MSSSSSPMGGSHGGLALAATAMALSGTLVLISLCRGRVHLSDLAPAPAPPPPPQLRSCLSSSERRRREKGRRKTEKRVRFADDVVDNESGRGARSPQARRAEAAAEPSCRSAAAVKMPANREALYRGMLRDRSMQRVAYSY